MVLKPAKTLLAAVGLCGLLALQLPAQGGLGAPPGRMGGGGVRGGSSGRAPQSDGHIPSAGTPSDSGTQGSSGLSATPSGNTGASRPTGNILFPGTPGRSNHGSIVSPGLPGSTGHTSILSPGLPGPYRPGNVLTPGTPLQVNPPAPYPGGLFSGPVDRGRPADQGPGFGRHRRGAVVYPYVYFGYPYGYGNGGYAIETGGVTRTSSSASYVVEGHLDTTAEREPHSRIYEVGPGTGDGAAAVDSEPAPSDGAPAASGARPGCLLSDRPQGRPDLRSARALVVGEHCSFRHAARRSLRGFPGGSGPGLERSTQPRARPEVRAGSARARRRLGAGSWRYALKISSLPLRVARGK